MALTTDIVATYRSPRKVIRRLMAGGEQEARALMFLLVACALIFVGQWPRLQREAISNAEYGELVCAQENTPAAQCDAAAETLQVLVGGSLMAWIFLVPLALYVVALLSHWVARIFRGQGTAYLARLALFWSLLASTPLWLLSGLVAGLIGPGPALTLTAGLAFGVFLLFWMLSLWEVQRPQ